MFRSWPCALACALCAGLPGGIAAAQDAAHFSPTYAASGGSPYSSVYARAFGAGGPPLETSAPPPALAVPAPAVVYVIEGGRLLTYRAEDYARGSGAAVAHSTLPAADPAYGGLTPEVRVPTIADRLYDTPPVETAAGPDAADAPIPLLPGN